MGLHTACLIDNDRALDIAKNPQKFVQDLHAILRRGSGGEIGQFFSAVHSVPKGDTLIYVVHANRLVELSEAQDSQTCWRAACEVMRGLGIKGV